MKYKICNLQFIVCCALFLLFAFPPICVGQAANRETNRVFPSEYTYVPRNLSRPGDFKVVVVPAINARQARIDAQTYHIGWDAVEAREGQSRVMYEVLLRKRPPHPRGTPPVTRRIPR